MHCRKSGKTPRKDALLDFIRLELTSKFDLSLLTKKGLELAST